MKQKTNFFKKVIRSTYDMDAFSEYAKEGLKNAILYIVLLSIIFGGIKGAALGYRFYKQVSSISKELQDEKYNIYINDGQLNVDNSPIKFEESYELLVYIDDEKTLDEQGDLRNIVVNENSSILFLKDGIVVNKLSNKYDIKYSALVDNININGSTLIKVIENLKVIFIVSSCIIYMLTTLIDLLINYLIIVIIASFITIFMKMVVKHKALWSLAIYASTLPFIVVTILEIFKPYVDFELTFILGTLTYLILILRYIKLDILQKINNGNL